jgi:hypothetical protein
LLFTCTCDACDAHYLRSDASYVSVPWISHVPLPSLKLVLPIRVALPLALAHRPVPPVIVSISKNVTPLKSGLSVA